ncbi:MAG: hypothetical protein NVS3B14_13600 [Ktedonobacteraceae bacterium]
MGLETVDDLGENYATARANENLKISFFPLKDMQVALPNLQMSAIQGYRTVLEFHVEDLDSLCATLRGKGIQFISGPTDHPDWGIRTAYFLDPDSNLVELFEMLE